MTDSAKDAVAEEFREFVYIVSHDFGAPVRGMVEFSKLLNEEYGAALNDEAREYLTLIVDNGRKMQAMMAALLDYSRLNNPVASAELNFDEIVRECQTVLQPKIDSTKATLQAQALPQNLTMGAEPVRRLFLILLDNALKFHPPGNVPEIAISAKRENGEWIVSVRDNGIGIDPAHYDKLFKPFRRLHLDSEYSGIGMGLAQARKIVAQWKGRLWIDSATGKGTTFHFSLPATGS